MIRNHIMDPESSQGRQQHEQQQQQQYSSYGDNRKSSGDDAWFNAGSSDFPQHQQQQPQQHSQYGQRAQQQQSQYDYQSQQQNYAANNGGNSPNSMSFSMHQQRQQQSMNTNNRMSIGGGGGGMGMGGTGGVEDYENEPPLLEELGINFDHIWTKTQAVVNPNAPLDEHILDDADLAGPIFFCLLLGACLLLSGKIHFGYIYGFSVFGCLGMHSMLNLMVPGVGLDFYRTCSVLGYCLLPVVSLAFISIILSLRGFFGLLLSAGVIGWCTYTATRMFDAKLHLAEQFWLVAYPAMLFYSCFVLLTVF